MEQQTRTPSQSTLLSRQIGFAGAGNRWFSWKRRKKAGGHLYGRFWV